jgi:cellulose synthase/poly-beta-1,6-N-acetylglucosamine synthase-like glycosyltransferase
MLERLANLMNEFPEVEVFGGPNATPVGSGTFEMTQGAVLASMVGAGPVRKRYGPHPAGIADERFFILCNLAIRRRSLLQFSADLICAEENALLIEMNRRGLTMYYDPDLVVWHERRGDWRGFAQQMHKYGVGRGQVINSLPSKLRFAYIVPSLFLLYLLLLPGLIFLGRWAIVPAALYMLAVAASSGKIAITIRNAKAAPTGMILTVVLHACYGAGVLRGALVGKKMALRGVGERASGGNSSGEDRFSDVAG